MESDPIPSAYAGRWVARLRGRIIAQGGTPEAALRLARVTRYKEKPEILYVPIEFPLPPLVDKVRTLLPDQELYLVGGAVRDVLLGRPAPDLDFAVPSNAIRLARQVANSLGADYVTLDSERDTGRVIVTASDGVRTYLDFASYRTPGTAGSSSGLDADLHLRDFTINAIAYDLQNNTLLDPLEGGVDLRLKRIRLCSPDALNDDPVRVLRGVRLAAALGFQIEKGTREAMKAGAAGLLRVSSERQRDELFKILEGPRPDSALRALELLGVLPYLLPELSALKGIQQSTPHVHDVWDHTLAVLQNLDAILAALAPGYNADLTNDLYTGLLTLRIGRYREQIAAHLDTPLNMDRSLKALLFFTALYHDVSKPHTRSVEESGRVRFLGHDKAGADLAAARALALHLSNDEIDRVRTIIANHMRFHFHSSRMEAETKLPSRKAIYRFFRDSGLAGVDQVLLGLADLRGTRGNTLTQEAWSAALDVARLLLENYWEKPQEAVAPPRLVDGFDLMKQHGIPPGPRLGKVLEAIREAQAVGVILTPEAALEFARLWLEKNPEN